NVNSVSVSVDGRYAVSGISNKSLIVWDLSNGKLIKTLMGHKDIITSVAFLSGGKSLVSGSYDKTIKIWDIDKGEILWSQEGHTQPVTSVAVSPNNKYVVSGSRDNTAIIWDASTGKLINKLKGHSEPITSLEVSPYGDYVVSGSEDNSVKIWDMKKGKHIRTLEGHNDAVTSVSVSPDGLYVASGSKDQTVKVWKLDTGELDNTFEKINSPVTSVAFSSDVIYLACGTEGSFIRVWDIIEKYHSTYYYLSKINSAKFIPDTNQIIAGYSSGDVLIWDILMQEKEELLKDLRNRLVKVEDLIDKKKQEEAIDELNYILESADLFGFEELKTIAYEKLRNLRDPEETLNNVKKILEFEAENLREISKAEMVNRLGIEISETDYYKNLISSPIDYESSEVSQFEHLGTEILKEYLEPSLYDLVVKLGFKLKTAKKVGKFLKDKGFIKDFRKFPLRAEGLEAGGELGDILVFISYATVDAELFKVKELAEGLKAYDEIGEVLYWEEHMTGNIYEYMSDNIDKCDAMILICTENSKKSDPVKKEWTAADADGKLIIPVFKDVKSIPALLKSRLGIEFDLMDMEKNIAQLRSLIVRNFRTKEN
ncbi:MAG: TIR domain-containing protein, partial [Promethearchaeota archaeon]